MMGILMMPMQRQHRWFSLAVLLFARCSHCFYKGSLIQRRLSFIGAFESNVVPSSRRDVRLHSASLNLEVPTVPESLIIDDRPHEQRAASPRYARRQNHSFRHLFRHEDDRHNLAMVANLTPLEFLVQCGGYTEERVYAMNETFPPLLDLNVRRHLWPKLRFLQETIGVGENPAVLRDATPAQYFGARLERTIAPRHAFLVFQGLPHGPELLQETESGKSMWHEFLISCRRTKQFCALCNTWKQRYGTQGDQSRITAKQIEAFDVLFQRGLMAAARDELCQNYNAWPLQHINITSAEMISLLVQHGANPIERDTRGVSLLHWAAGSGNLGGVKELLRHFQYGVFTEAERDGATPFHWAAAGAKAREFGCGGHPEVCRYFFEQLDGEGTKRIINKVTKDGNSVLMWAAWSGTLDVVKLLIRNRADPTVSNRNGCTVAHWAASGGNIQVCQYLARTVGVDFTKPNFGGNTPLTHAVAFGRVDVVEWLRNEICDAMDDSVAAGLAKNFVGWTEGDENRKQVLNLFQDWFGDDEEDLLDESNDDDNDFDFY